MFTRTLSIAAGLALFAGTAQAQVLLNDSFNAENGGATQLNYNAFANWDVLGGSTVDLIGSTNGFGLSCVSGACVDLSGSTGATSYGNLRTKTAYSFAAGDVMSFQMAVSGNQRGSSADYFAMSVNFLALTSITDVVIDYGSGLVSLGSLGALSSLDLNDVLASTVPFYVWSLEFRALNSGSAYFGARTSTTDNIGPIVDNALITRRRAAEVPEPASVALLMAGLLAVAARNARCRRS